MPPARIYLAGPECFLPDAVDIYAAKIAMCREFGFIGVSPFDAEANGLQADLSPQQTARKIYGANIALMQSCDVGIFNLTPFRGPSADVGTAFELGFMTALGKPGYAYTHASGDYVSRIEPRHHNQSGWFDENGWLIEIFGGSDNLMLDGAVEATGRRILRRDEIELGGLSTFGQCLAKVRLAPG